MLFLSCSTLKFYWHRQSLESPTKKSSTLTCTISTASWRNATSELFTQNLKCSIWCMINFTILPRAHIFNFVLKIISYTSIPQTIWNKWSAIIPRPQSCPTFIFRQAILHVYHVGLFLITCKYFVYWQKVPNVLFLRKCS